MSTAVSFSTAMVRPMSPCRVGAAAQIRATVPAVCGEAIDVPLSEPYPPLAIEDLTFTPGAARFGLRQRPPTLPRPEVEAIDVVAVERPGRERVLVVAG